MAKKQIELPLGNQDTDVPVLARSRRIQYPRKPRVKTERISRTKQSYADVCNINKMIARGRLPLVSKIPGRYVDCTIGTDYQQALNIVKSAESAFMSLPAKVRSRFQNNPQALLEFLADPNNKAEAIELGLIKADPIQKKADPSEDKTASKVEEKK